MDDPAEREAVLDALVAERLNLYTSGLDEIRGLIAEEKFDMAKERLDALAGHNGCQPCAEEIGRFRTKVEDTQSICERYPWMGMCVRENLAKELDATRSLFSDAPRRKAEQMEQGDEV